MIQKNPLVTFLLVTYNQEDFVVDALRGAIAQDYDNLEIIIADDCSTDNTLLIVKEIVAKYDGPHRVRVVPAVENVGLFGNIQRGCAASTGDLLVIGAGDDIPLPHRVTVMMEAWRRTGAVALHSHYDAMNEAGVLIDRGCVARAPGHALWGYLADKQDRAFVGGATSAYDRRFLGSFPPTSDRIFHEDSMLTLAIHAIGGSIVEVPQITVHYRVHDASYSNRRHNLRSVKGVAAQERDLARYARDGHAYLNYLRRCWLPSIATNYPSAASRLDLAAIDTALRRMERQQGWIEAGTVRRLAWLSTSTDLTDLRFTVPRMFGLLVFAAVKVLAGRAFRTSAARPEAAF